MKIGTTYGTSHLWLTSLTGILTGRYTAVDQKHQMFLGKKGRMEWPATYFHILVKHNLLATREEDTLQD